MKGLHNIALSVAVAGFQVLATGSGPFQIHWRWHIHANFIYGDCGARSILWFYGKEVHEWDNPSIYTPYVPSLIEIKPPLMINPLDYGMILCSEL